MFDELGHYVFFCLWPDPAQWRCPGLNRSTPGVGSSSEFPVCVRSDRPKETDDTSPSASCDVLGCPPAAVAGVLASASCTEYGKFKNDTKDRSDELRRPLQHKLEVMIEQTSRSCISRCSLSRTVSDMLQRPAQGAYVGVRGL